MTPKQIHVIGTVFSTQLGWVSINWTEEKVCQTSFGHRNKTQALRRLQCRPTPHEGLTNKQAQLVDRIKDFAAGAHDDFQDVPIEMAVTTRFKEKVYKHCRRIPRGETVSYKTLATKAGSPNAARAVGNAMASNPLPLIIPCHRVVAAAGNGLGGFSAPGGVSLKERLLNLENDEAD